MKCQPSLKKHFLFCFLLFTADASLANQSRSELWTNVTVAGRTQSYLYELQPQLRFNEQGSPIDAFIAQAKIGQRISQQSTFWVGGRFGTNELDTDTARKEIRFLEELKWDLPNRSPFKVQFRTRLEQRKAFDASRVAHRFRERIDLKKPWRRGIGVISYDELFVNLNHVDWISTHTFDQNRFYLGVENKTTPSSNVRIGYLFVYVPSNPPQANHILQCSASFHLGSP